MALFLPFNLYRRQPLPRSLLTYFSKYRFEPGRALLEPAGLLAPISRDELRDYADMNSKEAFIDPAARKIPGLPHEKPWTGEEP
jgi:hypothetical protein